MFRYVGWYDSPDQAEPAKWPDTSGKCPLCGLELGPRGINRDDGTSMLVSTSLMADRSQRSLFYFLHRACRDDATPDQIADIESAIIDGCH
jgi:hypothetical protein